MSELKPRYVCDLCRFASGDVCIAGGVSKCCKCGVYTLFQDRRAQPSNEPLTLEQLREMDGEPIYLIDMEPIEYGWEDEWYLVDADEDVAFNGIRKYDLKSCVGFAYRRPPERSEDDAKV